MTSVAPGLPAADSAEEVELDLEGLRRWARRLGAAAAERGVFVALHGPLGAGKTTLVQAACEAVGVVDPVLSPTFTLVHRYSGEGGDVLHVDLYRIEGPAELHELGWEEMVTSDAPVFVEWAGRAGPALPADRWDVTLGPGGGPDRRTAWVRAVGGAPSPPEPAP